MTGTVEPTDLEAGRDFFCGEEASLRTLHVVEGFAFQRCTKCGLVLVNPRLTDEARWREVYTQAYHAPRRFSLPRRAVKGLKEWLLLPIKPRDRQVRRVRLVERYVPRGPIRLLDVGCWTGEFLERARELHPDWQLKGLEPGAAAAEVARSQRGLEVVTGALEEGSLPPQSCEAVTMWHVLEHLSDPPAAFRQVARLLAPGGFLLLRTPNYESLHRRLYRRRWCGFLPREHLYIFTLDTLRRLLEEAGLEMVRPRPFLLAKWASSTYVAAVKSRQPPIAA